jgi:FemAB-related protein (PEP-CTERM system-associated)
VEKTKIKLLRIDASDENRWNEYVQPRASSVTDLFAWRKILDEAYRIPAHFIAVEDSGSIIGALGLFEIKHPLFGHYLTTAAFSNDGGFYYENTLASDLLVSAAKRIAEDLNVDYLLIRTRGVELEGFAIDRHYQAAVLELGEGVDTIWEKKLRGKTRNQVRRGLKEGFTIHTGHDQVEDFFRVFHTHMRDLGSPAHGRRFYDSIVKYLGDQAQFIVVRDGKSLAAGALLFELNGTAMNHHTIALQRYNTRCPNYLLYWEMIKNSSSRGNSKFDMGRSEAEGPHIRFKKNWGTQVETLTYNYYLRGLEEMPYVDPRNPRYSLAIAAWKKLPLFVTEKIGAQMMRGLA